MIIPEQVYGIYHRCYQKFPELFGSSDDAQRREGNRRAIATIRAKKVPDWQRWVWKTAHSNGSSPSKDAMGFVPFDVPKGEIVHLAAKLGRKAPVNARIAELVADAEANRRGSPRLSAEALLHELDRHRTAH